MEWKNLIYFCITFHTSILSSIGLGLRGACDKSCVYSAGQVKPSGDAAVVPNNPGADWGCSTLYPSFFPHSLANHPSHWLSGYNIICIYIYITNTTWNFGSVRNCRHPSCKNIHVTFDVIAIWNHAVFLWTLCRTFTRDYHLDENKCVHSNYFFCRQIYH